MNDEVVSAAHICSMAEANPDSTELSCAPPMIYRPDGGILLIVNTWAHSHYPHIDSFATCVPPILAFELGYFFTTVP